MEKQMLIDRQESRHTAYDVVGQAMREVKDLFKLTPPQQGVEPQSKTVEGEDPPTTEQS